VKVDGNGRLTFVFEGEEAAVVDYQASIRRFSMATMHDPTHPGAILKEAPSRESLGVVRSLRVFHAMQY
jgi:hypothetical protein